MGHEAAPRLRVDEVALGVDDVGDPRARGGARLVLLEQRAQLGDGLARPEAHDRRRQVRVPEAPLAVGRLVPATRHQQARARHGAEPGRDLGHGFVDHPPEWVDGDELVERPRGRDPRAGRVDRGAQGACVVAVGVGDDALGGSGFLGLARGGLQADRGDRGHRGLQR